MLKPPRNPDSLMQKKVNCKCGRKMIVGRSGHDSKNFLCSTCRTFGLEKSRIMFLEINRKSNKTIFSEKINEKEVKWRN